MALKSLNEYIKLAPEVTCPLHGFSWSSYDEEGDVLYIHFREPLNKSVTWVFIPTRRSCKGRNLKRCGPRFPPLQERRGEGAGVLMTYSEYP